MASSQSHVTSPPDTKSCLISSPLPGVLLVLINRSKTSNSLTVDASYELASVFAWFDQEPCYRVAIISGVGKVFCAGADLKEWMANNQKGVRMDLPESGFGGVSFRGGKKPIIAAVNGPAHGGGCEMIVNCDIVIASSTATFSLPEVKRGVTPFGGALPRIMRTIGRQRAAEMALTGRAVTADEMKEWGICNFVVVGQSVVDKALEYARMIAGEKHDQFEAFPTYPLALVFKQTNQDVIDFYSAQDSPKIPGGSRLDTKRLVDGHRAIEMLKRLPVVSDGHDFEFQSRVQGIYDKGSSGTVVESEDVLVHVPTGEVYARIVGSMFYIGQGNWGGPRGPKEPVVPRAAREPDNVVLLKSSKTAARLYRLNGDYNPLHAIPEVGQAMGFGGIITHGVFTYNRVAHGLVQSYGNSNPGNLRKFQAKFTDTVKPEDDVRIEVWRARPDQDGWEEIIWVATVVGTGKMCLSDGKAEIRTAEQADLAQLSAVSKL
ncbi:hypothetical protein NW762_010693 [Fusarium torreyae]|uniref:MaoC-like domain-containing protein n=1 Tax=Fusarium torreyae TaxID=1237075 RepID=A0A9W8RUT2_9HYPO|nr:hypothetical protein NW762_010693 [Fusarium torreyae]